MLGNGLPQFLPRDSNDALPFVEHQIYANGIVRLRYRLRSNTPHNRLWRN